MDILWRVFHILTEPVPYTLVSVNRRNIDAPAHMNTLCGHVNEIARLTLQCGPALHYFVDLQMQTYMEGTGPVKIRNTRHKISVNIRIFLQYSLA